MLTESIRILEEYFKWPYGGHVFIFTNKVTLADIQQHSFTEILSHKNAVYSHGHSLVMSIFNAMFTCANGLEGKKILDVGGSTGCFSFLATEAGANVTMVEKDPERTTVAKAMAEVRGLKVEIINDSIQNYLDSTTETYDCAFMLNMFDQMLREDEVSAWKTIKQISERCRMLFLMMGPTKQMPTVRGIETGNPPVIGPVIEVFNKPDYEVICEKTNYKSGKTIATHIYGNRHLQAYW